MKKLLVALLSGACCAVFASPANFPIQCNSISITPASTLSDVQQCLVKKQKTSNGLYEVKFKDNNEHTYTCTFATNTPTAQINSCED